MAGGTRNKTNAERAVNKSTCTNCKLKVCDDEKGMQCDVCEYWYHAQCMEIPDEVYNFMTSDKASADLFDWTCYYCKRGYANIKKRLKTVEDDHKTMKSRQKDLDEGQEKLRMDMSTMKDDICELQDEVVNKLSIVSALETQVQEVARGPEVVNRLQEQVSSFETQLQERVSTIERQLQSLSPGTGDSASVGVKRGDSQAQGSWDLIEEMNERKSRENNIVIHGIVEDGNGNSEEKQRKDAEEVEKLFRACGMSMNEVHKIDRLGKPGTEANKRPIRVIFKSLSVKMNLLRNTNQLKGNAQWQGVSIMQDLTWTERQKERELKKVAQEMGMQGNGKYLVVGPPWRRRVVKARRAN